MVRVERDVSLTRFRITVGWVYDCAYLCFGISLITGENSILKRQVLCCVDRIMTSDQTPYARVSIADFVWAPCLLRRTRQTSVPLRAAAAEVAASLRSASAHMGQIAQWPQTSHPKLRLWKSTSFHAFLRPHNKAGGFALTTDCLSARLRSDVNPAEVGVQVFSSSAGLLFYMSLSAACYPALARTGIRFKPGSWEELDLYGLLPSPAVGGHRCFHLPHAAHGTRWCWLRPWITNTPFGLRPPFICWLTVEHRCGLKLNRRGKSEIWAETWHPKIRRLRESDQVCTKRDMKFRSSEWGTENPERPTGAGM